MVVLALVGIGIVMVYSTTAILAGDRFQDPYYFLKRQAVYAGIGFRPDGLDDVFPLSGA